MMVSTDLTVTDSQHNIDPCNASNVLDLEYDHALPGYLKVWKPNHQQYLPPALVHKEIRKVFITDSNFSQAIYQHGPAITIIRELQRHELPETLGNQSVLAEEDYVISIAGKGWPQIAASWPLRERPNEWPTPSMVKEIVSAGYHIVPVSNTGSDESNIHWRLSFSIAELKLARSIGSIPRRCYLLLKSFYSVHLKSLNVVVTYHLKNILFWECEKQKLSFWSMKNLAQNTFHLLSCLRSCLVSQFLPHYFIPSNNLLKDMNDTAVQGAIAKIDWIRANPIEAIQECDTFYRLDPGKFQRFAPVIEAIKNKHCATDYSCFRIFYTNMIVAGTQMGEVKTAVTYIEDSLEMFHDDNDIVNTGTLQPGSCLHLLEALKFAANAAVDLEDKTIAVICLSTIVEAYKRLGLNDESLVLCQENLQECLQQQDSSHAQNKSGVSF